VIPQLVVYRQRRHDGRWLRLYIPVLPVLLLLVPLVVLAVLVACLVYGVSPTRALRGAGRVLWALPGTRFHLDDGHTAVCVTVI
jgi:hypothetical protein